MNKYDIVIIGAGPAGYHAALVLSKSDLKIAIIDKSSQHLGGTCLNEGCIPVKSLRESALLYDKILKSQQYGLSATVNSPTFDKLFESVNNNINTLKSGLVGLFKKSGVHFLYGEASFVSKNIIKIEQDGKSSEIQIDKVIVASGSKERILKDFVTDDKVIYSSDVFNLRSIPRSIMIVGAGYIGCEYASIFNMLGSQVTLVEMEDQIVPFEDKDTSRQLIREFKKLKIKIQTSTIVTSKKIIDDQLEITIQDLKSERYETKKYDLLLLAAGRVANIDKLNLSAAGIQSMDNYITVNEYMQSNVKNIYAIGDIIATPMLAHCAYKEADIVVAHITGNTIPRYDISLVPRVLFSKPECAAIGLTEKKLQEQSRAYHVKEASFKSNGKAVIGHETGGFVKVIIEDETEKILGTAIVGLLATELIHEFAIVLSKEMTLAELTSTMHAHPTLSEVCISL